MIVWTPETLAAFDRVQAQLTKTQQERDRAFVRIAVLEGALEPFAEFARGYRQQRQGVLVPKTGEIYSISNRAGDFDITVEALEAAIAALSPPPEEEPEAPYDNLQGSQ